MADTAPTFTIRDHRAPGWFWAQNEVISVYGSQLGPHGIAVYMALALRANNGTGECQISCRRVAAQIGMSAGGVCNALRLIVELGLARLEVSGSPTRPATYVLADLKPGGVHPVNASVHPVNAVFMGCTPYKEDKTFYKTKPNPPTPLLQRGVSKRDIRRVTKELDRWREGWVGISATEHDDRVDAVCVGLGISPTEFRAAVGCPRCPTADGSCGHQSQEAPCTKQQ